MSEQEYRASVGHEYVMQLRQSVTQQIPSEGGLTNYYSTKFDYTPFCAGLYPSENRVRFDRGIPKIDRTDTLWWYQGENPFCVMMALFQLLHQHNVYPSEALRERLVVEARSEVSVSGTTKGEGILFNHLIKIYQQFPEARQVLLEELQEGKDFFSTAGMNTLTARVRQGRYERVRANFFAFQELLQNGKFAILNVNPWVYDPHPTEERVGYHAVTLRDCFVDEEGYSYAEIADPRRGIFTLPLEMLTDALIANEVAYVG